MALSGAELDSIKLRLGRGEPLFRVMKSYTAENPADVLTQLKARFGEQEMEDTLSALRLFFKLRASDVNLNDYSPAQRTKAREICNHLAGQLLNL
jgi:hypothetical protein